MWHGERTRFPSCQASRKEHRNGVMLDEVGIDGRVFSCQSIKAAAAMRARTQQQDLLSQPAKEAEELVKFRKKPNSSLRNQQEMIAKESFRTEATPATYPE